MNRRTYDKHYDVVVLDDAMIDEFYVAGDDHLAAHGIKKGATTMASSHAQVDVAALAQPTMRKPGGSGCNSSAALHNIGAKAIFAGKIGDSRQGDFFRLYHETANMPLHDLAPQARECCGRVAVFVDPVDHERSMLTLQPKNVLRTEEVPSDIIKRSKILFLQGYGWVKPASREAIHHAISIAQMNGTKTALSLSAPFCVGVDHGGLKKLIEASDGVDILFANRAEIEAYYPSLSMPEIEHRLEQLSRIGAGKTIALTLGEEGSLIFDKGARYRIAAVAATQVVDKTGAGDAYAAGVLHGLTHGMAIEDCGMLGAELGARAVAVKGGRLEQHDIEDIRQRLTQQPAQRTAPARRFP